MTPEKEDQLMDREIELARADGERKGIEIGAGAERARCVDIVQRHAQSGSTNMHALLAEIDSSVQLSPAVVQRNARAQSSNQIDPMEGLRQAQQVGAARAAASSKPKSVIDAALDLEEEERAGFPSSRSKQATDTINAALDLESNHVVVAAENKPSEPTDSRDAPPAGNVVQARR